MSIKSTKIIIHSLKLMLCHKNKCYKRYQKCKSFEAGKSKQIRWITALNFIDQECFLQPNKLNKICITVRSWNYIIMEQH